MSGLLLIDIQVDFCPPSGSLAITQGDAVVEKCNTLRKSRNFTLIALTKDWHPENHASFPSENEELFSIKTIPTPARTLEPKQVDSVEQVVWPRHCVQGTPGAEFHHALIHQQTDLVVLKGTHPGVDSYSGFGDEFEGQFENTGLGDKLTSEGM